MQRLMYLKYVPDNSVAGKFGDVRSFYTLISFSLKPAASWLDKGVCVLCPVLPGTGLFFSLK